MYKCFSYVEQNITPKNSAIIYESCRDLQGRSLKIIKDATKLVEYLNKESDRKRKRKEEIDKKIEEGLKVQNRDKIMENIIGVIFQACSKGIKKDKGKGKEKEDKSLII
ncbi:hypothetical protein U3516DRAFT_749038 [Neocallimastix sp. 'constans']